MDASSQHLWGNAKKHDGWIVWEAYVWFCRKMPRCLPKWPYHFTFPPAKKREFLLLHTLPAFSAAGVLDLGHSNSCAIAFQLIL